MLFFTISQIIIKNNIAHRMYLKNGLIFSNDNK